MPDVIMSTNYGCTKLEKPLSLTDLEPHQVGNHCVETQESFLNSLYKTPMPVLFKNRGARHLERSPVSCCGRKENPARVMAFQAAPREKR